MNAFIDTISLGAGCFARREAGERVFALYDRAGDRVTISHVEAAPALRGSGASDRLMADFMAAAARDNLQVTATCGWAAQWLARRGRAAVP